VFTRRHPRLVLCVLALLVPLTGCAGFWQAITTTTTTGGSTTGDYVFVGKTGNSSVAAYAVATTGLTAVTGSPFSIAYPPLSMVVTPSDAYLYVGTSAGIYGFSIGTGGVLTALNSGAVIANTPSAVAPSAAIDVSPDGNYLAVLSQPTASSGQFYIYVYSINSSTGLLTYNGAIGTITLASNYNPATASPHSIHFAPNESTQTTSVIVAALGTGGDAAFTFNSSTGAISALPTDIVLPPSTTSSDNAAIWNSSSTAIFIPRGGSSTSLAVYTFGATTGVFTTDTAAQILVSTGNNPTAAAFNQAQSDVYVTNATDATVSAFAYSYSGTSITVTSPQLTSGPYTTSGAQPNAIAYDKSGNFIFVLNQSGPPDLLQYTVDGITDPSTSTPGRLYINSSVATGLSVTSTVSNVSPTGVSMALTH
jgi:6-phosphogluconolactonase (cycloisomerase 2 family)